MSQPDVTAEDLELPIKRTDGDTLEERLTSNAYDNILPARYLRKDADGNVTEQQEELFERVAHNIALAEAVYEADRRDTEVTVTPDQVKPGHPRRDELAAEVFGAGTTTDDDVETALTEANVNKFAYETVVPELPGEIAQHVQETAAEFRDLMEQLAFMPNSPTLMNAGDELQQLSACFVDSPDDDITDIHQTAKEAAEVFQCLTEESTVVVEGEGPVSVSEVEAGDRVAQQTESGFQFKPVEETHTYENAETLTVSLTNGLDVRGTPNHRLLVDGEWTRLDEIQAGQEVHYALGWLRETSRETPTLTSVASGAQWGTNRSVENAEILELYREGLSDYEIAERLDCGKSTVQRRRSHELELPPNGSGGRDPGSTSFDESEALELYEQGHSDATVAEELGVSTASVARLRAREQLAPNGTPVKTVQQPERLTDDLAELIGLWVGDGSAHEDGVRFHVGRESVADYVDELSRQLFGTDTSVSFAEGCYEVTINSHEIKRWWEANFDCKPNGAQSARVPQTVKRAPAEVVRAFLRGYFTADGTLLDDTYPKLYSSSERAIDDVATLMMGLGYPVKKSVVRDEDAHPYYGLVPTTGDGREAFLREVGFVDERRETGLANAESVTARDSHTVGEEYTVTVDAVTESDPATVYDITVADNHEYVTDGIVSHNSGGGMGYAFWQLRPYGDPVGSTGGIASGPITFMRTYDQLCETIAQGGARRGAQMGVMRVSHPDVIQFIHAKNKDVSLARSLRLNDPDDFTHTSFADALEEARELIDDDGKVPEHLRNAVEGHLSNFNISVGITDGFMEAVKNDEEFTFTNPRTEEPHVATHETKELYEMFGLGEHVEVGEELSVPAAEIWDHIVEGAHENGEPGVVYLERINEKHSFDVDKNPEHQILATNPCGEQPLEEYEACNLGHINLSTLAAQDAPDWRVWSEEHEFDTLEEGVERFLREAVDFEEFDHRIQTGTRFLENVVTMSDFPVDEIAETVASMRKIGLGIMGLAQLYIQLGVKYGDEVANEIAEQLMTHINHESKTASHELAEERGSFAEWDDSKYADPTAYREWFEHHTGEDADEWADGYPIRNHNTTTIAPTGCVEENSLVSTDDGLRPIKDLDETTAEFEQWDEINVGVTTDGGTKAATAVYDNGFADVRQIETEGGFSVAATPNHRFRTLTENGEYAWKEADDFESGDRIVLQRNTFDGGSRLSLDTSEREEYYRNTDDDLELPDQMTPELAEFLGYFMGDGYVHDGVGVKLVVESEATELDDHLRELGERLFGVTPTVEDRETRHMLTFGGRHLPRYFEDNGWKKDDGNHGEGAASAFVPEEVLRGDEPVVKAFLRGLFEADGTASRKVELSTVSDALADQVQTLLLSLGCVFVRDTLEMEDVDDHYGDRPRHSVRGANKREDQRFLDEVGFVTKSTEFELNPQSHRNDTYPPSVVDHLRAVDGYDSVSKPVKKRVNQSPINGAVSRKLVRDVEAETGETVRIDGRELTDFYAATVESVTEGTAYTKDISVPSNNTYVADGFVTHNTTSMVGNTTGGCEPIYNVAYYKNVSDDVQGDEMLVEFDDYFLRTLEANDIDVAAVKREAQEQMATNEFDGVDGLETVPDAIGELFVVTGDLDAKDHAGVQVACQAGVDSAISKCLEAGTLVQTDSGVRPIESFGDETPEAGEFTEVEEDVTIDGVAVESQYYAGEKDATRVRVDNGSELVGATDSHKVLTPDGWTVLGDLEEGDYVIGRHTESHGDGNTEISFSRRGSAVADGGATVAASGVDPSVYEKEVTLPSRMSPALARFLGMYAADGSAIDERYTVEISTSSERVREEARDLFEELFGREPSVEADTRGGESRDTVYGVRLNSKPVWEFVTTLCGSGSYEKDVPRSVLRGSPEEKLAFVNGVTLDGYVSSQSLVVYGGMSRDLADGVASLVRSFGVPKVYVGRKWVAESEAYAYQVHLTNEAQELVTPIEPHKQASRFDQRYRVYVPESRVDKTNYDSRSQAYYAARSVEYREQNYMFDTTAERLGIDDAPPLHEVTEVEDAGTREMYDIELAGPHEYVVGGVVSHNTVNAPNDSTLEDARDVFEYIYDHGGKGVTYYRDGTRSKQVLTTRADNTEFADETEAAETIVQQISEVFGGVEAFLDNEDVQAAVDAEIDDLLAASERPQVEYTEKRPRPDSLTGVTQLIETGYGKMYVTINEDPQTGEPFELFANIGHSGGFTNSFTESLAKVISTALRSGVDPAEIVDELQGTRSPKVAWDKGEQIQSIPDAIGTAMRRYLDGEIDRAHPEQQNLGEIDDGKLVGDADAGTDPEPSTQSDGGVAAEATTEAVEDLIANGESPECPECGSMTLYYSEGCKTCESCGWSEC